MPPRFTHRTALVTGAASGIGRATALRLASEGAQVLVADVDAVAADAVAAEIIASGGRATAFAFDVADEAAWPSAIERAVAGGPALDVLVNNAGISRTATIEEQTYADWRRVIEVTQDSVFLGQRAASAALAASGRGAVVNVSSMFGLVGGFGDNPSYHAAKAAVTNLTRNTALAWAARNVRVNSVHPGFIDTPLTQAQAPEINAFVIASTPMKRAGQPLEVANGCLFLASDESSYMTGAELVIDGGYLAQ